MGRPLRKDRLDAMKLVATTKAGEKVVLGKQVGFNKYVVDGEKYENNANFADRGIVRLVEKFDENSAETDAILNISVNGKDEAVLKITKFGFSTVNGVYGYELVEEGIKFNDAEVKLVEVAEEPKEEDKDEPKTDSNNGQSSITVEGEAVEGFEE